MSNKLINYYSLIAHLVCYGYTHRPGAEGSAAELSRKRIMNKNRGQSVTEIHFGQVKTEIKPKPEFKGYDQALDAMLVAAHSNLLQWVVDNTLDPEATSGKQEQIKATVKDGQREIAEIIVNVPTTPSFAKAMYANLLERTIVPAAFKAFRAYPSTGASPSQQGQRELSQILPDTLQQTGRVKAKELQTR